MSPDTISFHQFGSGFKPLKISAIILILLISGILPAFAGDNVREKSAEDKLYFHPDSVKAHIQSVRRLEIREEHKVALLSLLGRLPKLTYLRITAHVATWPRAIDSLPELRELYFFRTGLYELPHSIRGLKKLKILDLYGDSLSNFPLSLFDLPLLESLDLRNNFLKNLPTLKNPHLKKLYLSGNPLERLPDELALDSLEEFSLAFTPIRIITAAAASLPQLKKLDLSGCTELDFKAAFQIFGSDKHLTQLTLWQSGLESMPQSIELLQHLQSLDLSGNPQMDFSQAFKKLSLLHLLKNLTLQRCFYGNYENQMQGKLPAEIQLLQNIEILDISRNTFAYLPQELAMLTCLKSLDLSYVYKMRQLPDGLSACKSIEVLNLAHCDLLGDLTGIGKLTNLRNLNLDACPVSFLPEEFFMLSKLEVLEYSWSRSMKELPKNMVKLKKLNRLVLNRQYLKTLPENMNSKSMPALKYIEAGGNLFKRDELTRIKAAFPGAKVVF